MNPAELAARLELNVKRLTTSCLTLSLVLLPLAEQTLSSLQENKVKSEQTMPSEGSVKTQF